MPDGRIVNYGARLARRAPYYAGARYRAGFKIAQWAWRHRRGIKRTYRFVSGRFARRSIKRSRYSKRTEPSVKRSNIAHQSDVAVTTGDILAGTFYAINIDFGPNRTIGDSNMNQRAASLIWLNGIKICRQFMLTPSVGEGSNNAGPMMIHWALIQYKSDINSNGLPDVNDFLKKDFFRQTNAGNKRVADFPDDTNWSNALLCNPINPTKINILTHKKFMINPRNNQSIATNSWHVKFEHYFKINKKIQFSVQTQALPDKPFYELYWATTIDPATYPSGLGSKNVGLRTYHNNVVYFNNSG